MQNEFGEQKGLLGIEDEQSQSEATLFWNAFSAGAAARNENSISPQGGVSGVDSPEAHGGTDFFKPIGKTAYPLQGFNANTGGLMTDGLNNEKPYTTGYPFLIWKYLSSPYPHSSRRMENKDMDTVVVNGKYRESVPYSALEYNPDTDKRGAYYRVGTRSLDMRLGNIFNLIRSSFLDRHNLQPCHEQLIEHGTNTNYGKVKKELGAYNDGDNINKYDFSSVQYGDTKYYAPFITEAIKELKGNPASVFNTKYNFLINNCQDCIDEIMDLANKKALAAGRGRHIEYEPGEYERRYTHGMLIGNTFWQG